MAEQRALAGAMAEQRSLGRRSTSTAYAADVEAIAAALLERGRLDADEARRMAEGPPVEE